jgi:transcriptional regulator with XRE-family HTH domain
MSSLGQWLKNERKKHGLNLSDLARKAGISKSTVCRIENEQVLASFGSAGKMAEAMGLTLGDFFVRRNKEKEEKKMSYLEKLAEDNFQDGVLHELKRIAVATEKIADALGKQNGGAGVIDKGYVEANGIAAEFI